MDVEADVCCPRAVVDVAEADDAGPHCALRRRNPGQEAAACGFRLPSRVWQVEEGVAADLDRRMRGEVDRREREVEGESLHPEDLYLAATHCPAMDDVRRSSKAGRCEALVQSTRRSGPYQPSLRQALVAGLASDPAHSGDPTRESLRIAEYPRVVLAKVRCESRDA